MIPLCNPQQQYLELKDEIDEAIAAVSSSGEYILGPQTRAFEAEMAEYCGCKHAVGVNSGTDALHLSLKSLGVGPGDEVITSPFTFIATSEAICMTGATPVFVDIDPRSYTIDPIKIKEAITDRTVAILPVHLFGMPCDMEAVLAIASAHDLLVVEDCAQATGAEYRQQKVGSLGDAGCFSFFPSKNLGGLGDGGMIVTNNTKVYERAEMLRRHGSTQKYRHEEHGYNSRLDELQAAILRVKLKRLDAWNDQRRQAAEVYSHGLAGLQGLQLPGRVYGESGSLGDASDRNKRTYSLDACNQYTIQVDNRDALAEKLFKLGVKTAVYYPTPLHLQTVYHYLGYQVGSFPISESLSRRCLSLPIFPGVALYQEQVMHAVRESLHRCTAQAA